MGGSTATLMMESIVIAAAGYLAWILRWRREATLARPLNAESLKPPSDLAAPP
jgi:hypothetical protein